MLYSEIKINIEFKEQSTFLWLCNVCHKCSFMTHSLIHYILPPGSKFLCSEVIAPIRSEVDDISLFIINFEDLTNPTSPEPIEPVKLSKRKHCTCSFRLPYPVAEVSPSQFSFSGPGQGKLSTIVPHRTHCPARSRSPVGRLPHAPVGCHPGGGRDRHQ